jgi:predicted nucleotidyltransferase component of viral defense system
LAAHSRLTALQQALLEEFFSLTEAFFLTGGAALAGFHLGHRATHDLDFFTASEDLETGVRALRRAAARLNAGVAETRTSPDFRRFLVSRGDESLVVDLVLDRVPQIHGSKLAIGRIRVDPLDEIFANKLCALLGRAEIRDLVDVLFLEREGLSIEEGLAAGRRKDGGLTPAQLAWVLSQIDLSDAEPIPADLSRDELDRYRLDLIDRLLVLASPRHN